MKEKLRYLRFSPSTPFLTQTSLGNDNKRVFKPYINRVFLKRSETTPKQDQDLLISIVKSDPDFSFKNANFDQDQK